MKKATIVSRARDGSAVSAVRDDRIFEIKSTYILQPGPASLTDGVRQMHAMLCAIDAAATIQVARTRTCEPRRNSGAVTAE